jgi:antitoxin component YwqK of YwqJK toxin-antitoxin module
VNGKEHGVRKEYCYKAGVLRRETPYVNGEKHGIERDYDKEGTKIYYLTLYDKDQEVAFVRI